MKGFLERKKNGEFEKTAHHIRLDPETWAMIAFFDRYPEDSYPRLIQCCDILDKWVTISDSGEFIMEDPLFEDVPVVGYFIAGIDEIEGDHDEAVRACAECTYATICLAATLVGSALLGPVGAAVASAVAGYAAMYVKAAIGRSISDPAMRNEVTAITVYRVLMNELFIIAGAGIGEMSGAFSDLIVDELLADGVDQMLADMAGKLGKKGLKSLTKEEMKLIIDSISDAVKHGKSEDDIKHMFDDFANDGVDLLKG
ncbi:hypothetical protein N7495_000239 [Penicillium taxi]|uniref:uncharacterized protein n=1 Tax=Penicillium taxi TaxID=168475 RepID=UPI002545975D|nr:uncharacterized protein N7495_000239 [Penicillium taxi]KAJ5907557.1 hypothetical protein N7495_000239 [Penicillium taxi]